MLMVLVLILSAFLGIELIKRVPSQLHTPLMSGSNAISGVTIVGAIAATAAEGTLSVILACVCIVAATINVVGGYIVTNRMLGMFGGPKPTNNQPGHSTR